MRHALLAAFVAVTVLSAQDAPPAQVIRGQVVDARDNVPLRRARVVLTAGTTPTPAVFTDDEGRFTLTGVVTAASVVRASKAGYAPALMSVQAGNDEPAFRLSLQRSAAVMGRVLDTAGAPVSGAFVTGRMVGPEASAIGALTRFFQRTDRLGEYRLGGLPGGTYEVVTVRIPPELNRGNPTSIEATLFGSPAALEVARGSSRITLRPGDEAINIDFTLPAANDTCVPGPRVRPADGAVSGTIQGRVTAVSGEPIVCASVQVVTAGETVPPVSTDSQGRYSIEALPAGTFTVEVRAFGYVTLQYGQRLPGDPEVAITLRAGEQRARVDVVLPRGSIISGTVVDEHGEPVEGMLVQALSLRRREGLPLGASPVLPTSTDDRGRYRLIGVDPGNYLVSAVPSTMTSLEGSRNTRGYAPIYFPGTADATTAQRLAIDAGRDAEAIDLIFTPVFMATVTGTVRDAMGGPFVGDIAMSVSDRSGVPALFSRTIRSDANGVFTVPNVPPGDYAIKAPGRPAGIPPQYGLQYVTIVDTNPAPVAVVMSEAATLEGRVIVEGAIPAAGLGISTLPVDIDYLPNGTSGRPTTGSGDGGSFRLAGVRGASRVLVRLPSDCESCFLKSVRVNGVDATDAPFDFGLRGGTYPEVEIVVSTVGAAISGRVTDASGASVQAYSAMVFSTLREHWFNSSRFAKIVRSNLDGTFNMTGLPPGDYFVVALNRVDQSLAGDRGDADALEQLSARAERVTLAEQQRSSVNLRLVRR